MAAGVAALITLTAAPAGAVTIPPLSGSASVSDSFGTITGSCFANLVEFTNSGNTSTDIYELRGNTDVLGTNTAKINCSIPGSSQTFVADNSTGAPSEGVGEARVVQPITATSITVCVTVVASWGYGGTPTSPPGGETISNCSG